MNEELNIISCYTRQDAINDGTFIDVSGVASKCGFTIPVAITRTIWERHIKRDIDMITDVRLSALLLVLNKKIREDAPKDDTLFCTKVNFNNEPTDIWLKIEGQSPTDPSPAMNIFLPEEY